MFFTFSTFDNTFNNVVMTRKIENITGLVIPREHLLRMRNNTTTNVENTLLVLNDNIVQIMWDSVDPESEIYSKEDPVEGMFCDYEDILGAKLADWEIELINKELRDNGYEVMEHISEDDDKFLKSIEDDKELISEFLKTIRAFYIAW